MTSQVDILYFASLRETLDLDREKLDLPTSIDTMAQLIDFLGLRGGIWQEVFTSDRVIMMSVNQEMANLNSSIKNGDEVAFFPPVTGG